MQLIFSDPYYDSEGWTEQKFQKEFKDALSEFDSSLTVVDANIGHGADWPCALVDIFNNVDWKSLIGASLAGIFLLGDKINKNLNAWLAILDKFSKLVQKVKPTRIDEQAAIALTLNSIISKGYELERIELGPQIVPFMKGPVESLNKLESNPDALYIVSVKAHDKAFVFGIKSNGNFVFEHELSTFWADF